MLARLPRHREPTSLDASDIRLLDGVFYAADPYPAYAWLRERPPTARIAHTWFEYQVAPGDVPRMLKGSKLGFVSTLTSHDI